MHLLPRSFAKSSCLLRPLVHSFMDCAAGGPVWKILERERRRQLVEIRGAFWTSTTTWTESRRISPGECLADL